MTNPLELCDELDRLREAVAATLPWELDDSDQEGIVDNQQRPVVTTDNRVCLRMFILAAANHSEALCDAVRRLTAEVAQAAIERKEAQAFVARHWTGKAPIQEKLKAADGMAEAIQDAAVSTPGLLDARMQYGALQHEHESLPKEPSE